MATSDPLRVKLRPALERRPLIAWSASATSLLMVGIGYAVGFSNIWLVPFASLIAGIGLWGCWTIGHDCLHGGFAKRAWINEAVGNALFLPTLFPYYTAKRLHLEHHSHLNNVRADRAWRPWTTQEYAASSSIARQLYRASRGWAWFAAPLMFLTFQHFVAANAYPRERTKARVAFVAISVYLGVLLALILFANAPLVAVTTLITSHLVFSTIFAILTLMQHTGASDSVSTEWHLSDIPGRQAPLDHTIDIEFPRFIEPIFWNGNVHSPHHIEPKIPFYNLRAARSMLAATDHNILSRPFTLSELGRITRDRQVFDLVTGDLTSIKQELPQRGLRSTAATRTAGR